MKNYYNHLNEITISLQPNQCTFDIQEFQYERTPTFSLYPTKQKEENANEIQSGKYQMKKRKLHHVKLDDSIEILEEKSFSDEICLESIQLSSSLKYIEDNCFTHCEKLKQIEFPEHLIWIGNEIFSQCPLITQITIPKNIHLLIHIFLTILYHLFYSNITPSYFKSFIYFR